MLENIIIDIICFLGLEESFDVASKWLYGVKLRDLYIPWSCFGKKKKYVQFFDFERGYGWIKKDFVSINHFDHPDHPDHFNHLDHPYLIRKYKHIFPELNDFRLKEISKILRLDEVKYINQQLIKMKADKLAKSDRIVIIANYLLYDLSLNRKDVFFIMKNIFKEITIEEFNSNLSNLNKYHKVIWNLENLGKEDNVIHVDEDTIKRNIKNLDYQLKIKSAKDLKTISNFIKSGKMDYDKIYYNIAFYMIKRGYNDTEIFLSSACVKPSSYKELSSKLVPIIFDIRNR